RGQHIAVPNLSRIESSGIGCKWFSRLWRSVLWLRLAIVALGPLRENSVSVFRHPAEIVLDHRLFGRWRIIGRCGLHFRVGNDGIVLAEKLIGAPSGDPVGDLLSSVKVLRALDDGGRLHVPAGTLFGQHDVDRRTVALLPGSAHVESDADHAL